MIVDDATLDWLAALRAHLVADAALASIVGTDPASGAVKIFNRPPGHTALPYISFGDTAQRAFSTSDSYGQEILVDVHCWAMRQSDGNQSSATATARQMMARVEAVVHMQPDLSGDRPALTIAGRNLLLAQVVERSQLVLDPDGETNHGYLRIAALIGHG
ncbi:MAG: DUF3168 domain-containing protein [Methylobacteriaceae bacterium]|nr:DUF3168 domain-containing protein [Methylobacteriaceae bacterium]